VGNGDATAEAKAGRLSAFQDRIEDNLMIQRCAVRGNAGEFVGDVPDVARAQARNHTRRSDQGCHHGGCHHQYRPRLCEPPHASGEQGTDNRPGAALPRHRGLNRPFGEVRSGTACAARKGVRSWHYGNACPQGKFKPAPEAILKGSHAAYGHAVVPHMDSARRPRDAIPHPSRLSVGFVPGAGTPTLMRTGNTERPSPLLSGRVTPWP
jgi:hypothetical protein